MERKLDTNPMLKLGIEVELGRGSELEFGVGT